MYFLVDNEKLVIFGWSAKSGCSHIKNLFYFLSRGTIDNKIHTQNDVNKLPFNLTFYTVILFIRNPYKRLISGYLNKYKINGMFRERWDKLKIPLTFTNFVNELMNNSYKYIDKHHFTPQLSEQCNMQVLTHPNLILYDIENINYQNLEKIFNKQIPKQVLEYRGTHFFKGTNPVTYKVYDLHIDEIIDGNLKPTTECFYNQNLKNKVYKFYQNDFVFFKSKGFNYVLGEI
jgi:hypothetical protein